MQIIEEQLIKEIKKLMLETTTKFLILGDYLNKLKEINEVSFRNLVEWGNGYSYTSLYRFMKISKEYNTKELRKIATALGVKKADMILKIDDSKRLTFIKQTFYDNPESTMYNVDKIRMSCKDLKEKIDLFNISNGESNELKKIKKLSEKRVISSLSDVLDKQVAKINELYSNKTLTGDQIELQLKLQECPEDVPTGEMPRHIVCMLERNLVDHIVPGSTLIHDDFHGHGSLIEAIRFIIERNNCFPTWI